MSFFLFSNTNVQFVEIKKLTRRNHTALPALLITKKVELTDMKKFSAVVLDTKLENFVLYVAALPVMTIHASRKAQIKALIAKKALSKLPAEYSDYADVFSPDIAIKLPEHIGINNYLIDIMEEKKLPYSLIYSLSPVE